MSEVWKDIAGYEGHYQVSNLGNVRSIKKGIHLMKPKIARNGYCNINLFLNGKTKTYRIHRLVAKAFIPNALSLNEVNHIDENKQNNAASNLEWCSHLYNTNYGNIRRKRSIGTKKSWMQETYRKKVIQYRQSTRWINNGEIERFVPDCKLPEYIAAGWKKGRLSLKGRYRRQLNNCAEGSARKRRS